MVSLREMVASGLVMAGAWLALSGITGCAAPQAAIQSMPDMEKIGLRQVWMRKIPILSGEKIVNAWRVGDSIYVTTTETNLTRIQATEGTMKWQVELRNPEYRIFRPAELPPGDKYVLVVNKGTGFIMDKQTGDFVERRALSMAVTTDPIIAGDAFCVGGVNAFRALYLDVLGGQKWVTPARGDIISARPAVEENTIVVATDKGELWRVMQSTGDWIWKDRKVNGRVIGGLAADARAVYIPCLDNHVYAFDMNNGSAMWSTPVEGRLDRALTVTRSEVLVPATGKGLYALSNTRGDIKWLAPGVSEIGTIVRDRVWVSDPGGNLSAISLETGEVLATIATNAVVITNPVDQLVLLIDNEGTLAAYAPTK